MVVSERADTFPLGWVEKSESTKLKMGDLIVCIAEIQIVAPRAFFLPRFYEI